jgi:hypothetical protein
VTKDIFGNEESPKRRGRPVNMQGRLIERWQHNEEMKGFAVAGSYRRHANAFTLLAQTCGGNEDLALRVIDRFFDDDFEKHNGWSIAAFQGRFRGYLKKLQEADAKAAVRARMWQEEQVERAERSTPEPSGMPAELKAKLAGLKSKWRTS